MPIKVQNDLPARAILESENIFVMDENRAMSQDIRPLQILILNLMPIKERVEAAVPELEKIIVDKMPSNETDAITENIISETQKELAQAVSQHTAAAEQETPEQQDQSWRYSTGGTTRVMPADAVRNNLQTDAPAAASAGAAEAVPQEPEAPDQAFDAQQLQKELAESMREIISGIHPAETEAEIVEPKNDMSFFRDRAGNVPVQEPKESIDDILVSMSGADETASTEEKEPEREIPEMPDLQVENEQPKEAVQPSGEERIPAPQAAAQDPGMAASGFAALEAQAAKMRAEAEQAAGLNERLAAHAGVNAAAEKKVEMPGTTAPDMASGTLENSQTEKKTAAQPQVPVKKPEQAAREQRIQSVQQSQAGQPVMSQPAQGQQQAAAGVPQQSSADQKAARVSQAQGVIRMERAGRNTEAAATQQNPYQQAAYRPNQSLTLSQQQLFSYFSTIQGLQEQIACAMKETLNKLQKDKTSRSGNLVITGDPGSGRTTLGIRFAKALCQERGNSAARVAKIYAEDFNKKDIASTVAKIAGGTLIIEEAGDLSEESIAQLSKAMEFRTDGLLVILEDEKSYLKELFDKNPTFAEKFTSEISIPIMTNDELVTFGKIYAYDEDYRIDDSAMVALYNRIGEMQTPEHPVCIADVRDIVDDAISRSERTGIRKLGRILSHKRYDEDDRVILYEKDFK